MVVAALALDRLGDEGRDVVWILGEGAFGLPQCTLFGSDHLVQMITERMDDRRYVDSRPVELRKSIGLVRFGVGQRQGVAAPAVKGVRQMHDLSAEIPVAPRRLVLVALPVERDLEGVFDGKCAALDEEQVRERGISEHPHKSLDELCVRRAVHVRIGGLIDSDLA